MSTNQTNREISEIMRDEMVMKDAILSIINKKAMTIPEIAQTLGAPSREVTMWIMGMWRYGLVEEKGDPDENGYCFYQAKEKE